MIILIEPRMCVDNPKKVFLDNTGYDRIRIVPGLGWLVAAGYTGKTSIIRFKDGVEE